MLYGGQCGRQRGSATKQAQSVFAYTDLVHLPARFTCMAPVHLHSPGPPASSSSPVPGPPAWPGPPARPWVHLLAPVSLHGLGLSV